MNIADLQKQLDDVMGTDKPIPITDPLSVNDGDPFDWNPELERDDAEECARLRKRVESLQTINRNLIASHDQLRELLEKERARHAGQ